MHLLRTLASYYQSNQCYLHNHHGLNLTSRLSSSIVQHHARRYSTDQRSDVRQMSYTGSKTSVIKWTLGLIMTVVVPFWTNKWNNLLKLEDEVKMTTEVVEKVATMAEKASAEIANKLPENSKLKQTILSVEKISEEMAEEAHLALDVFHKVDELKEEVSMFIAPALQPKSHEDNKGKMQNN
ncbi:uncharacterized protein LOC120249958 [Dioscorea cayenensis subsp. rotundata]|uniref:Uncharacterized protein LOC120249958 n=1 Tax=Dioscorea cayennensis subsp. rotundata TaxID=55577 RepID=A0AB40AI17_DIOCR|nr:uncharacterized protein LOC120249958 [Dioscorea cayenensis subsp. rotundata]